MVCRSGGFKPMWHLTLLPSMLYYALSLAQLLPTTILGDGSISVSGTTCSGPKHYLSRLTTSWALFSAFYGISTPSDMPAMS
jgi:hypothetical protein